MTRTKWGRRRGIVLATIGVLLCLGIALVAGPAAASHDTKANYTVVLPEDTDHQPGAQNENNASVQFRVVGGDSLESAGASDGLDPFTRLALRFESADFSECDATQNTRVVGIDRGNNDSRTQTDEDLVQYREGSSLGSNGYEFTFSDGGGFAGPDGTASLAPDDEVVLAVGVGSRGGPCVTMPEEAGWYQGSAVLEGENADNETVTVELESHYVAVCEGCADRETAYERLGPPPGQPTLTPPSTPTPTATEAPTATPTAAPGAVTETASDGDGAGFGPVVALVALLAAALVARR